MKNIASDTAEDQKAWMKIQEGDIQSLEMLYRKYIQELYRFGLSICPEEDLVQDQIQEVFLELWQYHASVCLPSNCKFYLLRSLSNKIKRTKGKNTGIPMEFQDHLGAPELVDTSDLDRFLEEENFLSKTHLLEKAFLKLSQNQRKLIHLLYFENYSYSEASQILEITLKSTYTLAWKALKKLKKHLTSIALFSVLNSLFC